MRYQVNISKKLREGVRSFHKLSKECSESIDRSLKKSGKLIEDFKAGKIEIIATLDVKRKK